MNWIGWSLLMFFSSVALYLLVRKSSILQIPTQICNLAMFLVPFFAYATATIITGQNYSLVLWQYGVLIGAGILFSYLGNVASLRSIEYAPNPGYSLVLSKSYVVFTTIFSVIFFSSPLTVQKALAILLIIFFSALIMINRGKVKQSKAIWLPLAFVAFFCWGLLTLTSRFLYSNGVPTLVFLTMISLVVTPCILIEIKNRKVDLSAIRRYPWIFFSIGALSAAFNLGLMQAVNIAPNPGYVNAVNAASISLVAIMAVILFKDEFSIRKLIGVLGVVCGLILLLI